jgi:hypothetical protein
MGAESLPDHSASGLDVGTFKTVEDANDYIGVQRARIDRLQGRRGKLAQTLWDIVNADPVDLALDPTWAQRVAREGLTRAEEAGDAR